MELVQEISGGAIRYRLPNVPECLELMARIGLTGSATDGENPELKNGLMISSRIIANMGKFITEVKADFGDGPITSFDKLCERAEAMGPLLEIANRVSEALQGGSGAKKKQSETP